jgi:hypothetical protein
MQTSMIFQFENGAIYQTAPAPPRQATILGIFTPYDMEDCSEAVQDLVFELMGQFIHSKVGAFLLHNNGDIVALDSFVVPDSNGEGE